MPTYELDFEFDIVRRIGWTDEDLGAHIDEVFERLHQAHSVLGMDASANLDTGRSELNLLFEAERDDDPDHIGRAMLGVAIRASRGGHNGLLAFAEEATVQSKRTHWSGLRTPTWNLRRATLREVPSAS